MCNLYFSTDGPQSWWKITGSQQCSHSVCNCSVPHKPVFFLLLNKISHKGSAITPPSWNAILSGRSVFFHLWFLVVSFLSPYTAEVCLVIYKNDFSFPFFHSNSSESLKRRPTTSALPFVCLYFCQAFIFTYFVSKSSLFYLRENSYRVYRNKTIENFGKY